MPFRRLMAASCVAISSLSPLSEARAQDPGDYVDVSSYLQTDAQYEGWSHLRLGLARDFDAICGDTFCEGDYSNIQPLRYLCSVQASTGRIGMCAWVFAASNEEIDPATGRIVVQRMSWRCRTPLARRTTIDELIATLQVAHPLHQPLPRSSESVMDGLVECL